MHLFKHTGFRFTAGFLAALALTALAQAGPLSMFWEGGSGYWSTDAKWSNNEFGPYTQTFTGSAATFGTNVESTLTLTEDLVLTVLYVHSDGAHYTFGLNGNSMSVSSDFVLIFPVTFDFAGGDSSLIVTDGLSSFYYGSTLEISNFEVGTDVLRFGTSAAALNSTQLGLIVFTGYSNGGAAQIDANGYVTPTGVSAVPEPSTFAAIAGAIVLGVVGLTRRRRRCA